MKYNQEYSKFEHVKPYEFYIHFDIADYTRVWCNNVIVILKGHDAISIAVYGSSCTTTGDCTTRSLSRSVCRSNRCQCSANYELDSTDKQCKEKGKVNYK